MLTCREFSERASGYLNRELSSWDRLRVGLHILLCRHCRRYVEQFRTVIEALRPSHGGSAPTGPEEEPSVQRLSGALRDAGSGIGRNARFEIVIYTTAWCSFCHRAKALLDRKGARYREIRVGGDSTRRREMVARAGGRNTVPQIFIGGRGIGGCDDLYALESSGELDRLLGRA
jgi:glutaredoxin 3